MEFMKLVEVSLAVKLTEPRCSVYFLHALSLNTLRFKDARADRLPQPEMLWGAGTRAYRDKQPFAS